MEEGEVGGIKWVPIDQADDVMWAFDHDELIHQILERFGGKLYGDNGNYANPQQMLDKLISLVKSRADEDYIISFIEKIKRAV